MSRSVHANLKLQQAMQADAGILAAMNQKLIRDEGHRNRMNLEELTQRMKEFLLGEYRAVLFVRDESVVGYTLFKFDPDAVYARQFYVSQDFRRQGIGHEAFVRLRADVWKEFLRLRIDVLVWNEAGIKFWRSVDFVDYCLTMELEKGQ